MDEKDHCSTEDISDSEVQSVVNKSRTELTSLETEHTYNGDITLKSGAVSLPYAPDDSSTRGSNSSSTITETNSYLPIHDTHPSPRPRKFGSIEKPQPVPRSIPLLKTCVQNFDESNEDNSSITTVDYSEDIKTKIPNIPNQQDSVEDNIQLKEELNEKQDIGREKKSNTDYNDTKEISRTPAADSAKIAPSSSKSQQKRFSRNSSGIPMTRLPCRSSPLRSSTKIEPNNIGTTFDTSRIVAEDKVHTDFDKVDNPISSKEDINATTKTNEPTCSKRESNTRSEEKDEAVEALNKDLSGKYDDFLFVKRKIFSYAADTDDCRVYSTKVSETPINLQAQLNICKNSEVSLDISEEDNKNSSISATTSFLNASSAYTSQVPEKPNETSEAFTAESTADFQADNITRHDNYSGIEDNLSSDVEKIGSDKCLGKILDVSADFLYSSRDGCTVFNDKKEERLEMSCTNSANVDTRMLDPDAMIESLDRFTAELVSQASSHLQNKDSLYKSSNNDNTWDENSSPNEATFPSISVSAPNVISFNSESENNTSSNKNNLNGNADHVEMVSNDFSSLNTATMTESTLIAMEATKMAEAFKEDADMSSSVNSLVSFELDQVQPPSHLNSLSNSIIGFLDSKPSSPKMLRKKSLPSNIMVKRALNHSLSHNSSVENLDHYLIYRDDTSSGNRVGLTGSNPVLPNDISDSRKSFIINGPVNINYSSKNFSTKMPSSFLNLETSSQLHSVTDLDNINPPSIFNEVTDLCNSLADVATTSIGTETEIFEDCFTHVTDNYLQTENDVTEFSDANSITPIQSSTTSSSENTPKKKSLNKSLTSKQKRALAKERYKTYIIAAEMVMKDSIINQEDNSNVDPDVRLVEPAEETNNSCLVNENSTNTGQSSNIDTQASKLSPKERRLSERSRFQTQVLEVSQIPNFHNQNSQQEIKELDSSKEQSPTKSKISIRKNVLQRRLTNKERFKTQTLEDSQLSPDLLICESPVSQDADIHLMVEKEAKKMLKTLRDANINQDETLDCETISLVSNDDESEPNSGSSVNYRTYHKSWGLRNNIPVISCEEPRRCSGDIAGDALENCSTASDDEANRVAPPKPKIVKPDAKKIQEYKEEDEQPKGIRGRRKALYSKSNLIKVTPKSIKPVKNVTSNLAKNVTSTLKSATPKPIASKTSKIVTRPPTNGKAMSGRPVSGSSSTSGIAQKNLKPGIPRPGNEVKKGTTKPLERQGTFTRDEPPPNGSQTKGKTPDSSRIPTAGSIKSSIPKMSSKQSSIPRAGVFKSASSDRSSKPTNIKMYNRSTSADSRESTVSRRIQSSLSSHSLKSEPEKVQQSGAIKKTIQYQRSDSNSSLNGPNNTKKQVTSKIASIWKRIEETKKKTVPKKDSKKWIEAEVEPLSDATNSNVDSTRNESDDTTPKRISRLGSFVCMDENEGNVKIG